jgi:hypothetical protein
MRYQNLFTSPKNWKGFLDLIRQNTEGSLLINGDAYEWTYTVPFLQDDGWTVLFSTHEIFGNRSTNKRERPRTDDIHLIEKDPEIMSCFEFDGISFYSLLRSRFMWILAKTPEYFKYLIRYLRTIKEKHHLRAILTSANSTGSSHTLNRAGRFLGLKVLTWQHGFLHFNGRISQLNEFNDMMTSDVVLAFGKDAERAYQHYSDKFKSEIIPTGSASLDHMRCSLENAPSPMKWKDREYDTKRILYATTNYYENYWYYGFSPPPSDRYFFKDQLAILSYLERYLESLDHSAEVIVKLSPIRVTNDPPWVERFYSQRGFRIIKDSPTFVELLDGAHIAILDYPTTTVLQAIITNKPVFVLMRHIKYPQHAQKMLEKRAVCAEDVPTLMKALHDYLKTGRYQPDLNNNEFLRAYGNFVDDTNSASRATKVVRDRLRSERSSDSE